MLGDMTDLPNVAPLSMPGLIEEGNLLMTLAGLEPGWYSVRDLYPRYLAVEARLRNKPGNKIRLGMALKTYGLEHRNIVGHANAWHVTTELLARADEMAQGADRILTSQGR